MGIKYKVNETFFKKWSRDSAYILGFIYADGHLEDAPYIRGKFIRFTSTDYYLIEKIKKAINSSHKIVVTPAFGKHKEKYLLRIGSKKIYDNLVVLGLTPRKSLTMKLPYVPHKFLSDFIRGYFDGDGTIAIENVSNRPHNRLKVIFTSGSKNFLISLAESIKDEGISKEGDIYDSHRSYQLLYRSRNALSVLKFIYSGFEKEKCLFLERKYFKYRKLISEPCALGCANLFDRHSKIWHYNTNRRRTQVA
ncbi:MAG: LAGLIDADG family homing endonuclease [Candidatus Omnitrophota bacterium]